MKKIFTIGYERADLEDFLATLRMMDVNLLLDVREIPISRRKGFSKTALTEALDRVGIAYRHEKQLGSPKAIRHQLREDWDYERFFEAFDQHLADQRALLEQLVEEIKGHVALLCYERDHRTCHRMPVAKALAELVGIRPSHLGVHGHAQREAHQGDHPDLGQSLSPA